MGIKTMGNKTNSYLVCTLEEYFNALEENKKETKIVAKSLVKYLKNKNEKLAA